MTDKIPCICHEHKPECDCQTPDKTWWRRTEHERAPNSVVGAAHEKPYMLRWFVIPRNKFFNIYLHKFLRSDQDLELHDHPWLFNISILLEGDYIEETVAKGGVHHRKRLSPGCVKLRLGAAPHRVELIDDAPCYTLFITGPVFRNWGFHCPRGWVEWKEFVGRRGSGSGCG